jgi:hypothetical protein
LGHRPTFQRVVEGGRFVPAADIAASGKQNALVGEGFKEVRKFKPHLRRRIV